MKTHESLLTSAAMWALLTWTPLLADQPAQPELTAQGQKLEARYREQMNALATSLQAKIPKADGLVKAAYDKSLQAEKAAEAKIAALSSKLNGVKKYESAVAYRRKVLGTIDARIKASQKKADEATLPDVRAMALEEVAAAKKGWDAQHKGLEAELAMLQKEKDAQPTVMKEIDAAKEEWAKARKATSESFNQSSLGRLLGSSDVDSELIKFVVLKEATPRGLAEFAEQGTQQEALIERLLGDEALMMQMLIADGAARPMTGKDQYGPAKYGQAMKIYTDIRKASDKSADGVLQRLAVAVSLVHAIPVLQVNPAAAKGAPSHVDPVKRYLHYERAFLDGELDPAFDTLDTWELRYVVDGEEPDKTLTWGREMLRNFHPDHVLNPNLGWRYVRLVTTDVNYGSGNVKFDRPELQNYQNILMNGGICGRRAFIGRFVLRAFGIPTIARPSKGHGALAHWTPEGWVVNLGPGWGSGWTGTPYGADRNFLASAQGRADKEAFLQVKRAQWIGDVMGEGRVYGFVGHDAGKIPFWNAITLNLQQGIIDESKAIALEALGTNLGEADESPPADGGHDRQDTAAPERINYDQGAIIIPAAAFNSPLARASEVQVMKSLGGGSQIFLPRFGAEGLTILRGGAWRGNAEECKSGKRLPSDGLGKYNNWGLRAAMSASGDSPPEEMTVDLGSGVTMEMVYIKPGRFKMGGESTTDGRFLCVEIPVHEVVITKGYYLGKYEVTQRQFETVLGYNPSAGSKDPNAPADTISEGDAADFCRMASQKSGKPLRLPTEAEWEYATRAGTTTKWFFGDDPATIGDYAWIKGNDGNKSHPVGQKKPNPWGLYDICGNVWERVADRYDRDYYANSPENDPTGPGLEMKSLTEYVIEVPQSGSYDLTTRFVTVNYDQHLMVSVNDGPPLERPMPFTNGTWQDSEPVRVSLVKGRNTLKFWRMDPPQQGMAVKSHTLKLQGN